MAVGRFFLCSPDCPKQPTTSFRLMNYFIQPSLVGSLDKPHYYKWVRKVFFFAEKIANEKYLQNAKKQAIVRALASKNFNFSFKKRSNL